MSCCGIFCQCCGSVHDGPAPTISASNRCCWWEVCLPTDYSNSGEGRLVGIKSFSNHSGNARNFTLLPPFLSRVSSQLSAACPRAPHSLIAVSELIPVCTLPSTLSLSPVPGHRLLPLPDPHSPPTRRRPPRPRRAPAPAPHECPLVLELTQTPSHALL